MEGKAALVIGAAGEIGAAIAREMAREGAKVAVVDIERAGAEATAAAIKEDHGEAAAWGLDITVEADVETVLQEVVKQFGEIDALVNCAGITGSHAHAHEATEADFDRIFNINVKGVWLVTKYAIASMLRSGGGSIVNVSSIMGLVGGSSLPQYHATKGAVRLMTKADAISYASRGIRVNSVHPGPIQTSLSVAAAKSDPLGEEEYMRRLLSNVPLGHRGEPDDVAHGVVYLASDEAKFVTGAELVIDGGYTAR
ncbi:SDR family NAD(P)-dependent oxidoreductase [Actinomadura alba]|uniref:Glucose 1-dehydrogenase n=1 Tax=Actinomadura alba TaxID=406431 RepID=A0ABR7LTL4_9ACTN|nr:glucose 1-dehydrogenase [Actinomadura alba]MBC6468086.1 glucose 1-dehydrogenase [Actinomadura alba]